MIQMSIAANIKAVLAVRAGVEAELSRAVRRTAFLIERSAKTMPPPIDTGAMKASIYTATHESDARERALASAAARYRREHTGDLPEAPAPPRVASRMEAIVAVGVNYAGATNRTHRTRRGWWTKSIWRGRKILRDQVRLAAIAAARRAGRVGRP